MSKSPWVLLTGEYPPQPGGVSDYTRLVARGLAEAGDEVHVWAPMPDTGRSLGGDPAVAVHRLPGGFRRRNLKTLDAFLDRQAAPCRLLVQYVPHAFGWRGMNVPFCLWVARRPEPVWVMFHEVAFPLSRCQPLTHNLFGLVTRLMSGLVARKAERIFVSIPGWESMLPRSCKARRSVMWLPVPSNLPTAVSPEAVATIRKHFASANEVIIGHFGTYGHHVTALLGRALSFLLRKNPKRRALLLGRGSERFAANLTTEDPTLRGRIIATGPLEPERIAVHLAACDCLLQPYADGVSSRRTSMMAGLALGLPIVTNVGPLTDPVWNETNAVVLARFGSSENLAQGAETLLDDPKRRAALRQRAVEFYESHFSLSRTIEVLRDGITEAT